MDEQKKDIQKGVQEDDQITMPREQLQGLLQRLSVLESANKVQEADKGLVGWKEVSETERIHTATICKWRKVPEDKWMYAVDWYFHRVEIDKKTGDKDLIYKIKWLKEAAKGEEKISDEELVETEMKIQDFIKNTFREKVDIIDKEVKKLQLSTGEYAHVSRVDYTKFKTEDTGNKVPMIVTADQITFKVKLPEGRTIRLSQERLNA